MQVTRDESEANGSSSATSSARCPAPTCSSCTATTPTTASRVDRAPEAPTLAACPERCRARLVPGRDDPLRAARTSEREPLADSCELCGASARRARPASRRSSAARSSARCSSATSHPLAETERRAHPATRSRRPPRSSPTCATSRSPSARRATDALTGLAERARRPGHAQADGRPGAADGQPAHRASWSTSTTSSSSTTSTATSSGNEVLAAVGQSSLPATAARATSPGVTAARSSSCCCPTPTRDGRRRARREAAPPLAALVLPRGRRGRSPRASASRRIPDDASERDTAPARRRPRALPREVARPRPRRDALVDGSRARRARPRVARAVSRASTIARRAGIPEWPKGAGCKPAGSAFGGSNPPPCTARDQERNLDAGYTRATPS